MSRDGAGTYSLPEAAFVPNTTIESAEVNNDLSDIAAALTASIAKDGQTTPTANLPMGSFKLTGLAAGSAATDSAHLGQVQAQAYIYGETGGTANAQTLTPSPAITAYAAGQLFRAKIGAGLTNTSTVTLAVSGLTTKAVVTANNVALIAGKLVAGLTYELLYDGTSFRILTEYYDSHFPLGNRALFSAVGAASANATGDGTVATQTYGSEIADITNSLVAGTGIFTAPASGRYLFCGTLRVEQQNGSSYNFNLVTTARTYNIGRGNPANMDAGDGTFQEGFSIIADMTAADTASITIQLTGGGKTSDLSTSTYWMGFYLG
jgi:hypothetical protein